MSDLIYRHEAIKTITSYNGTVDKSVAKRLLLQMKSAQPRKKGKWLQINAGYYDYVKCDQCRETLVWKKNFCPNCGADMRGEEE